MSTIQNMYPHMNEMEELKHLSVVNEECTAFLSRWYVYIGHRTEAAEDAFVAITELQREVVQRIDELLASLNRVTIPF